MWNRILPELNCPRCGQGLAMRVFVEEHRELAREHLEAGEKRGLPAEQLGHWIEAGLLVCEPCQLRYPIVEGLPILLPYETSAHRAFDEDFGQKIAESGVSHPYPSDAPEEGEAFVLDSFSKEWLEYDYDGVIWEMSYEDHEARFLKEMGPIPELGRDARFLEVGCGLGISTEIAQRNFAVDAFGLDLSFAALAATRHFRENPFLHFVQASVFHLPIRAQSMDLIYSHGVLHHTWSTAEAFRQTLKTSAPGGLVYLWVYGPGSIGETWLRRTLYAAEKALRPFLSKRASSPLAKLILSPIAIGYWLFNVIRRVKTPELQPLTFQRALHAARDRFTPRFAHRHAANEVRAWFEAGGLTDIEVVDWRQMPAADHDDFRRNTGLRGRRPAGAGA